jgi:hypothetical protein
LRAITASKIFYKYNAQLRAIKTNCIQDFVLNVKLLPSNQAGIALAYKSIFNDDIFRPFLGYSYTFNHPSGNFRPNLDHFYRFLAILSTLRAISDPI